MIYAYVSGCLFFLFLQGFFSAAEIGFISSSLLKLKHRQNKGDVNAGRAYKLINNPERFLATTLVGANLSVVLSSSLLTVFLFKLGLKNSDIWATLLFTPLVVIFAELIPKNIGRFYREEFSCRVVQVNIFFEKLFAPLVISIEKLSKFSLKMFISKGKERSPFVTKEELKFLLKEVEKGGEIDKGEKEAIEEIFGFREDRIKDVCVGIKQVVGLDYTDSYEKILKIIWSTGFTRYPVFKNRDIIGYINIYDLFYSSQKEWHSLVRPITRIGLNQKLYEIFTKLKDKKESMALVYKGKKIYGIVTIQDLIREIITSIVK